MLELDGNCQEGGGALLRVALAASTLTNKPFKITNIRAGRPKPGLKAQHINTIKALQEMSGAKSSEAELGTTELWFQPGQVKSGNYTIDIGTAGSITLLLQGLILPCLFAPAKVTLNITGGTCGKWQASVDYLKELLLPQLKRFVNKIDLRILKRGYFPRGGGEIVLEITPKYKLKDFNHVRELVDKLSSETKKIELVDQGDLEQIRGVLNLSQELEQYNVPERVTHTAKMLVSPKQVPINIRTELVNTFSTGGDLLLWSVHSKEDDVSNINPVRLAGDSLLEKGKKSEIVAKEAAAKLLKELDSGAAVDSYLADQLLQFMLLLPESKIETSEVTKHCLTNIYVLEKFFSVKFNVNNNVISVEKVIVE
jgi:RNA 3'-phosphate cyclase